MAFSNSAAHDLAVQPCQRQFGGEIDFEQEHAFVGAAPDRQHAVRRDLRRRLGVLPVHLEFAFRIGRAFDGAAGHAAFRHHHAADRLAEFGVFADPFGGDVARAFERIGRRPHAFFFADEGRGKLGQRTVIRLVPEELRQRLESLFAGNGRLGAPLGFERQVEVFEFRLLHRGCDPGLQFRGEFPLAGNGFENRGAAILQFAEIFQLLLDFADQHFVEVARGFLAVAGDEGHGCAGVQQFDGGGQALQRDVQQRCNMDQYRRSKGHRFRHGNLTTQDSGLGTQHWSHAPLG